MTTVEGFTDLDDIYGEGAEQTFTEGVQLPDMEATITATGHQNIHLNWQGETRRAEMWITFTPTTFNFYSMTAVPEGDGIFASLVAPIVAVARSFGVTDFLAVAANKQNEEVFSRAGFELQSSGMMLAKVEERIGEYADWRTGDAEEPEWHRTL